MKKAFTIAEVLITLVIIGVVAALTISNLIVKHQKEETITKLKAANSILTNATYKAWQDWGTIDNWDMNLSMEDFGKRYLKPYVIYAKECTSMSDGCWKTDNFNGYYDLKGDKMTTTVPYSLILNNGMVVGVNNIEGHTIWNYIVDINGAKKPNKMGKDIFAFYIFNPKSVCSGTDTKGKVAGLYLGGAANCGPPHAIYSREELLSSGVLRSCNKNSSNGGGTRPGVGTACAALIVKDGWQIKPDYPW